MGRFRFSQIANVPPTLNVPVDLLVPGGRTFIVQGSFVLIARSGPTALAIRLLLLLLLLLLLRPTTDGVHWTSGDTVHGTLNWTYSRA